MDRFLAQLGRISGAQLTALLDEKGRPLATWGEPAESGDLLNSISERVSQAKGPVVWTEPLSNRPQPRINVELASIMVVPLELPGSEGFTVALHRRTRTAFSSRDLEATMRQMDRLRPRLGLAGSGYSGPPLVEVSGNRGQKEPGTASRLG
jgi:hypothetical protein